MLTCISLYHTLLNYFGPQGWWPLMTCVGKKGFDADGYHVGTHTYPRTPEQRFEVCVGAILTQNTSWKNVEKAMQALHHHHLLTKTSLQYVPLDKLAQLIKPAGYFNQKAKKLKAFAAFDGDITREQLLSIWGIGKETADSMLCYAYNKPVFVVDAYTQRIFHRLGFKEEGYDAIQQGVMKELRMTEELNEFHALLVELGKNVCKTKPLCETCPLARHCEKRDVKR